MIRNYRDHAANENTFLAWVRTGITVIAFGFVVEKFDLFLLTIADAASSQVGHLLRLEGLPGRFGRYNGFALIIVGIIIIAVAAVRFVRNGRLLDDPQVHSAGIGAELILSAALALLVAGLSSNLLLG